MIETSSTWRADFAFLPSQSTRNPRRWSPRDPQPAPTSLADILQTPPCLNLDNCKALLQMTSAPPPQPLRFARAARLRSFTNFSLLPYDVQTSIIVMGCRLRQTYETPATTDNSRHPVVHLDTNTAKSLALVNKTFNSIVTRTLYEKIHVTRPSTLRSLAVSIYDRPELGRFVKSLHIGPVNPLPKDWLPIQNGNLALSMSALTDKEQRPSWLSTPHLVAITYPHDARLSPSTKAISSAILSASRSLDVLLASEGCDRRGWEIPKVST